MDIDALKTFLEVNRTGHFGQAAKNLFVTQSTVSARIKLLEERLGVAIFIRQRNNLQLTPAGRKLLRYAETILTQWNRARLDISVADENLIPFGVGASPSIWDILLQPWMSYMSAHHADLVMQLQAHNADFLIKRLLDNTLDLAFVFDNLQSNELDCIEVSSIPLVLVTSDPDVPLTQALQKNYILVDWGQSFANVHARHFPDIPPPRLRVNLGRIARDYLLNSKGAAYLAEPMVAQELKQQTLHLVKDAPVIRRTIYAVCSHTSDKRQTIQKSIDYFIATDKLKSVPIA